MDQENSIVIPVPLVDPPADELEDIADETDELLELVQTNQNLSITQHTEITQRLTECQNQLEKLSTQQTAENPLLTQLLTQLTELRAELATVKSSLDTKVMNREQNVLIPEPLQIPDEPALAELIEEPRPEETPVELTAAQLRAQKNKFI